MVKFKIIDYEKSGFIIHLILWKYKTLGGFLEKKVNYILVSDNGELNSQIKPKTKWEANLKSDKK